MSDPSIGGDPPPQPSEVFLLTQVNVLLRWRWWIAFCLFLGGALGVVLGLLSPRVYLARATFLPSTTDLDQGSTSLALAASQFGLRLPTTGSSWGPPVYLALLDQRSLLAPIATEAIVVAEQGGRPAILLDLLEVTAEREEERVERGVILLRSLIDTRELRQAGGVQVEVTTRWPSVSLAIVERLVAGVQRFNAETRRSQAGAERAFVEERAHEAEEALREAEDLLQQFLVANRSFESPQLAFERDRLQRQVSLRQEIYTALLQSREEARVREVRDTPVITVIQEPTLPVLPESRRTLLKGAIGGFGFGLLGMLYAFLSEGLANARRRSDPAAQEFFRLTGHTGLPTSGQASK